MNNKPKILIACIGNIFFGDDGFGCEAARELQKRSLPDNVRLVDFGIRAMDLTYALLDDYDLTIFVDAVVRGEKAGTLYVIEPDLSTLKNEETEHTMPDAHKLNLTKVLNLADSMGAKFNKLIIVGCEPETLYSEDIKTGLSDPVRRAVNEAVRLIEDLSKTLTL